jgi:hypothetical protein
MTVTVNEEKEIALFDGSTISVRPLKISLLREFLAKFDTISEVAEDNIKSMDVLIECVAIALKQYKPELALLKPAELEDLLDLPTIYKVIEEASGIQLAGESLLSLN